MNILILNGSPRNNSNTLHALSTIERDIKQNTPHSVEIINVIDIKVGGCIACDLCPDNGGNCVRSDDSSDIMNKVLAADMVIFGTPVYWWGVSSQLKAVIDKFYSKTEAFKTQKIKKKYALVVVGADAVSAKQYQIISDQFTCIGNFLGWGKVFESFFAAHKAGELEKSKEANAELAEIWKKI